MITRLEVDGFKSLRGFAIDLGPFTALVGPNSAGKSNILEALVLLSRLASEPIEAAFKGGRGRAIDQFTLENGQAVQAIRFAVEMLLPDDVRVHAATTNRLRYELTIARKRRGTGTESLVVEHERLATITASQDAWSGRYPALLDRIHHAPTMDLWRLVERTRKDIRKGVRRLQYFEEADTFDGVPDTHSLLAAFHAGIHIDTSIPIPVDRETIQRLADLAAKNHTSMQRTIDAALRVGLREMLGGAEDDKDLDREPAVPSSAARVFARALAALRLVHLDSARLHEGSERIGSASLAPDASNLPTVLASVPPRILGEIRADLAALVPGISTFELVAENDTFHIDFELSGGERLPARLMSDGTLRALALLAALRSEPAPLTLAIEEPENGIYPGRLRVLLGLLREITERWNGHPPANAGSPPAVGDGEEDLDPVPSQVLVTSHSPVVLAAMRDDPDGLRFIDVVRRGGHLATRARLVGTNGAAERGTVVSLAEVDRLLSLATTETAR